MSLEKPSTTCLLIINPSFIHESYFQLEQLINASQNAEQLKFEHETILRILYVSKYICILPELSIMEIDVN